MPRLSKGHVAPGLARLHEEAAEAVRRKIEKWTAFKNAAPQNLDDHPPHFGSFSALAEWSDVAQEVVRVDPKTLRKKLNAFYPGGSKALVSEMRSVRSAVRSAAEPSAARAKSASDEQTMPDAVMEVTNRYIDLLERFKRHAERDSRVMMELERHMRLHGHRLRLVK